MGRTLSHHPFSYFSPLSYLYPPTPPLTISLTSTGLLLLPGLKGTLLYVLIGSKSYEMEWNGMELNLAILN